MFVHKSGGGNQTPHNLSNKTGRLQVCAAQSVFHALGTKEPNFACGHYLLKPRNEVLQNNFLMNKCLKRKIKYIVSSAEVRLKLKSYFVFNFQVSSLSKEMCYCM